MLRPIPFVIALVISITLFGAFLLWERSCDGGWASKHRACDFGLAHRVPIGPKIRASNILPSLAECAEASLEQQIDIQLPRLGICHDTGSLEASSVFSVLVVVVSKTISEDPLLS